MMIKKGYTRVSSLISQFHNFNNVDQEIILKKMEIGTLTHDAIEKYWKKEKTLDEISTINEYLDAFSMLVEEKELKHENIKICEKRYYNDFYMVTGMIDCIISYNDKNILVDWKTSANIYEKPYSLQLCIYKELVDDIDVNELYIVQLGKGYYDIHSIDEEMYMPMAQSLLMDHLCQLEE